MSVDNKPPINTVPLVRLNDGTDMPVLGLGTYDVTDVGNVVSNAIDFGYRLLDCADSYGNEAQVGEALTNAIDRDQKTSREDLYVVSKVWPTWYGRGRPTESASRSLSRLRLRYLDLLLIHWPTAFGQSDDEYWPRDETTGQTVLDEELDFRDVWREFEAIRRSGLVRSIGVSNFNVQQLDAILATAETKPVVNQIESHPLLSNEALVEACAQRGVTVMGYSPLARGGRNIPASPLEAPLVRSLAAKYGKSCPQICLRWQTQRPVVVIPRTSSRGRLLENINIFDFTLNDSEMVSMGSLDCGYRTGRHDRFDTNRHKDFPFEKSV